MREKPILFSAPMVRAILEGRKTQTRRIVKPQPSDSWAPYSYGEVHKMRDGEFVLRRGEPLVIGWGPSNEDGSEAHACPYGQPGDRLWVKETFAMESTEGVSKVPWYRADFLGHSEVDPPPSGTKWKPSIFMPRWASRITLEITGVRVERLQDISEEDAKAEGLFECKQNHGTYYGIALPDVWEKDPRKTYKRLWESINGVGSWALNPWVWVIEFKPLTPPQKAEKE